MGYCLNCLDEPVFIAVSKPLLTEFGIHHRLESCVSDIPFPISLSSPFYLQELKDAFGAWADVLVVAGWAPPKTGALPALAPPKDPNPPVLPPVLATAPNEVPG